MPFLVPIVIMAYLLTSTNTEQIDFFAKEKQGVEYLQPLHRLIQHVQQHRTAAAAFLAGDATAKNEMNRKEEIISQDISDVDTLDGKYGTGLKSTEKWTAVKSRWAELKNKNGTLKAWASNEQHSAVVADLLDLTLEVAEFSNLTLDPDSAPYFLQDSLTNRQLAESEAVAEAAAAGVAVLTASKRENKDSTFSAEEKSFLLSRLGSIQSERAIIANDFFRA